MKRFLQCAYVRLDGAGAASWRLGHPDAQGSDAENHSADDQPAKRFHLRGGKPFLRVVMKVAIPGREKMLQPDMGQRCAAVMSRHCGGIEMNGQPGAPESLTEINVLEPGREKSLIERPHLVARIPPHQQSSRSRLFHRLRTRDVQIAVTVMRGSRVSREQLVDHQQIGGQTLQRWEAAKLEVALRLTIFAQQNWRDRGYLTIFLQVANQSLDGS